MMIRTALILSFLVSTLHAGVTLDIEAYGKSLGGWKAKSKNACDYDLSGSEYRTYKPEITPTPDGGIFASVRIDHRRGWLASDDHAVLEVTIDKNGSIVSAQSNLALQGKTISSDVIRTGGNVGQGVPGVGAAVKVGADLTADLSSKLLREKIVEPGRVNFPAAVRHNYNLIYQAIRSTNDLAPKQDEAKKEEEPVQGPVKPPTSAAKLDVPGAGEKIELKK
ncbi:hypothetical protein OKA04_21240 [Luteolibacter flavescens]|uniref:Uncharacterized protein n=1 Tax=Luteolibacter flavescens TaxID=1859460 RepID=A0ABT3FUL8_9BACT|nr:hypothetical protein [Luteolibacter flavescens]MCW1887277.1 hypothetical protein [Luteolibacter flavescens]